MMEEQRQGPGPLINVPEWGKLRAAEALAALNAHELPNHIANGITIAQALYMLGAVVISLPTEEEQNEQMKLFLERLPDVMDDLRKNHQHPKETHATDE